MNLGLRYELDLPAYDTRGRIATFDPSLYVPRPLAIGGVPIGSPDFPFIQDGTRQPESFRTRQHEWYLRELTARGIPFLLAGATLAEQVDIVRRALTSVPQIGSGSF